MRLPELNFEKNPMICLSRTLIVIVLVLFGMLNTSFASLPVLKVYYEIGIDSTVVYLGGGYSELASSEVFEHVKTIDSLVRKNDKRVPRFAFHIGGCKTSTIDSVRKFMRDNRLKLDATACSTKSGIMAIQYEPGIKRTKYDIEEMKSLFQEANDNPDFFRERKRKREENLKANKAIMEKYYGIVPDSIKVERDDQNINR
jgi:hypothetical protein